MSVDRTVKIYGLMRSGNHLVTDWIRTQYPTMQWTHHNNVTFSGDPNDTARGLETGPPSRGGAPSGHLTLISYEDREENAADFADRFIESTQSRSDNELHVLIMRDPFNCLASRLELIRKRGGLGGDMSLGNVAHNWAGIAQHAVALPQMPSDGQPVITVLYNRFVDDAAYRAELSGAMGGDHTDEALQRVSLAGGGSSFDPPALSLRLLKRRWRRALDPDRWRRLPEILSRSRKSPAEMKVHARWEALKDDPEFTQVFADGKLLDLSEQLFGPIPGTNEWVKSLGSGT